MDQDAKKVALRMIPYGIYVMTARNAAGEIAAATVNWVTQTAFDPPLLAIGVKADSGTYALVTESGKFALNMLGKGQQGIAFGFFKPAEVNGGLINGEPWSEGDTGVPVLDNAMARVECEVAEIVERGDHHIVIAEVKSAAVLQQPEGRADAAILEMKELGETVFYGG